MPWSRDTPVAPGALGVHQQRIEPRIVGLDQTLRLHALGAPRAAIGELLASLHAGPFGAHFARRLDAVEQEPRPFFSSHARALGEAATPAAATDSAAGSASSWFGDADASSQTRPFSRSTSLLIASAARFTPASLDA